MGSKNLRAIAVRGTQRVPLANPEKVQEIGKKALELLAQSGMAQNLKKFGTPMFVMPLQNSGILPTRNFQKGGDGGTSVPADSRLDFRAGILSDTAGAIREKTGMARDVVAAGGAGHSRYVRPGMGIGRGNALHSCLALGANGWLAGGRTAGVTAVGDPVLLGQPSGEEMAKLDAGECFRSDDGATGHGTVNAEVAGKHRCEKVRLEAHRSLHRGGFLGEHFADAADLGADSLQLLLDVLVATVDVIDAVDDGLAVGDQRG